MWPTKVGKPWREKRRCTLHAGMVSKEFCKLCTKGRPAGKLTWCQHSRDLLDYCWWGSIQRSSPQNTGRAKTATTLRLEKCAFRHALGTRTFYTSPLKKMSESIKEDILFTKIFWLVNAKWIKNKQKSEPTFETPCITEAFLSYCMTERKTTVHRSEHLKVDKFVSLIPMLVFTFELFHNFSSF